MNYLKVKSDKNPLDIFILSSNASISSAYLLTQFLLNDNLQLFKCHSEVCEEESFN